MNYMMTFPKTIDEFIDLYTFVDRKEVYTNGSELIPVFRVQQAIEHYLPKWISVKERLPQDEQWVAALLYGFVGAIRNPISLQYNAMKRVFIDEDGIEFDIDDVAYWVGLPEPPEVKE